MRVLMLVTSADAPFFQQQVESLERQGVDVTVRAVPGEHLTTDDGTTSRSVWDYLRFQGRVLRAARGDFDLVHANYGLTGPAALAQPIRPIVLSLWGSDVFGRMKPVSDACARLADATIVMTDDMADQLTADCRVVPHGVDLATFRPFPRAAARDVLGWRADAAHVLFPYAKQRTAKDYPRAERVVDRVRQRLAERSCAPDEPAASVATDGGREDGRAVRDVELHAIHDVDHDRMPLYLNATDALVLPSKVDGSPNAVKEALACNTPVVATPVGDVPELVDGVENATVARTDDALVDALATVLVRDDPSTGRDAIQSLSATRMATRLRETYDAVLS